MIITHRATRIAVVNGTGKEDIAVDVADDDDDAAGVTIDVSNLGHIRENGGRDTYTVKLDSEPTANVIVDVVNEDPTVATVSTQSLTFTPGNWDNPKSVTVTGVNDNVDSPDRTASINHAVSDSGGYTMNTPIVKDGGPVTDGDPAIVMVTVTDDDMAGLTVTPPVLTISRGRKDTFTVKLNTEPTGNVDVTLRVADDVRRRSEPTHPDFYAHQLA